MEQLHIRTYVSAHDALLAGETSAGESRVPVTQELLAELSVHERKVLAEHCQGGSRTLSLPSRSPAAIVAALRAIALEEAAEQAEKMAKDMRLQALLSGPREGRLTCNDERPYGQRYSPSDEIDRLCIIGTGLRSKVREEADAANIEDATTHDDAILEESPFQHIYKTGEGVWYVVDSIARKASIRGDYGPLYPRAYARAFAIVTERNAERARLLEQQHERVLKVALSPEQWARYEAKVLPSEEREEAMRQALFGWCELPTFEEPEDSDFEHDTDCPYPCMRRSDRDSADLSEFELTAPQYAAAQAVISAYQNHPQFESIVWTRHRLGCAECTMDDLELFSARVTLVVGSTSYAEDYAVG